MTNLHHLQNTSEIFFGINFKTSGYLFSLSFRMVAIGIFSSRGAFSQKEKQLCPNILKLWVVGILSCLVCIRVFYCH